MMKKGLVLLFVMGLILPLALADQSLQIQKIDKGSIIISELANPAVFELLITNPINQIQQAEIYSFTGLRFSPVGFFDLQPGVNTIESKFYVSQDISQHPGTYSLQYEVRGTLSGTTTDSVQLKVIDLKDAISLSALPINVGDKNAVIQILNIQNETLENVSLHFVSPFFDENQSFSLNPFGSENVSISINQNSIKNLSAGEIPFSASITLENANANIQGVINYLPQENSQLIKSSHGIIIVSTNYTRTNTGNIPVSAEINVTKNILSRLFTVNSANPDQTTRSALFDTYSWQKNLQPGQSFSIVSTTNYTFPFILILVIIIVALIVRLYTKRSLVIDKRVSHVKTKGGEFALKVSLHVKANKYIENIQIIDRLPAVAQLYEKFGVTPDRIDPSTKRLFWNLDRLNKGEERVYSYIIYSRIRVVGRFELPSATGLYLRDGKTEQAFSNRAFFVSETAGTDLI